eukprot:gnl/Ergobibamus_cyprinoides/4110.p2 GENE.gnl/Ergobibamus_cyprinoides/4110~~gnl/Ergobibamus_cyprinoides/4110.p2  ORF type:complete len:164 (+),score=25.49 gnl/Ergobibamus_cyprinoides/4110:71-562(+)
MTRSPHSPQLLLPRPGQPAQTFSDDPFAAFDPAPPLAAAPASAPAVDPFAPFGSAAAVAPAPKPALEFELPRPAPKVKHSSQDLASLIGLFADTHASPARAPARTVITPAQPAPAQVQMPAPAASFFDNPFGDFGAGAPVPSTSALDFNPFSSAPSGDFNPFA